MKLIHFIFQTVPVFLNVSSVKFGSRSFLSIEKWKPDISNRSGAATLHLRILTTQLGFNLQRHRKKSGFQRYNYRGSTTNTGTVLIKTVPLLYLKTIYLGCEICSSAGNFCGIFAYVNLSKKILFILDCRYSVRTAVLRALVVPVTAIIS